MFVPPLCWYFVSVCRSDLVASQSQNHGRDQVEEETLETECGKEYVAEFKTNEEENMASTNQCVEYMGEQKSLSYNGRDDILPAPKQKKKANRALFYNRRANIIPAMEPKKKAKITLLYNRIENIIPALMPANEGK